MNILDRDLHSQTFNKYLGANARLHIFQDLSFEMLNSSLGEHADGASDQPLNMRYFRVRGLNLRVVQLRSLGSRELLSNAADNLARWNAHNFSCAA